MKIGFLVAGFFLLIMAGTAHATTFPVEDASMAAYVYVPGLSLPDAANAYYHIYDLNNSYIFGNVRVTGLGRTDDIKTYTGADGWVVAYVPRTVSRAQMIQWSGKSIGSNNVELFPTTLEDAIKQIAEATGANYSEISPNIKYYDFEYPEAENITVILDGGYKDESFSLLLPHEITVYDVSASIGKTGSAAHTIYIWDGSHRINLGHVGTYSNYGDMPANLWTSDVTHWIRTYMDRSYSSAYRVNSATILVYSTP
jgi:hypothetical protein